MSETIKLTGEETGSLKDVVNAMEAARKQAQTIGIKGLAADIKREIFDKFPNIFAIGFCGYTPSFNDGDPCYFRCNGPWGFNFEDGADYEQNIELAWDRFSDEGDVRYNSTEYKALKNIPQDSEIFETMFGESFQVLITRQEVIVRDYDCGY